MQWLKEEWYHGLHCLLQSWLERQVTNIEEFKKLSSWRASETLSGVAQLKIWDVCLFMFGRMYVILYFSYFGVSSVFDPIPNFTKRNPPVYRSLPISSKKLNCLPL